MINRLRVNYHKFPNIFWPWYSHQVVQSEYNLPNSLDLCVKQDLIFCSKPARIVKIKLIKELLGPSIHLDLGKKEQFW